MKSIVRCMALLGTTVVGMLGAVADAGAAPINLAVNTPANYLSATWQLETGSEAAFIEASTNPSATGPDGFFDDPDPILLDTLNPPDLSYRSGYQLPPGTYWAHVASCPAGESPDTCPLTWTAPVQFTIGPNPGIVPTLTSVVAEDGFLTADWTLQVGMSGSAFIEVATDPTISRFGFFEADPVLFEDVYQLGVTHTTSVPLPPGTYYVHVSADVFLPPDRCLPDPAFCTVLLWSNVLPVTVPAKPPPVTQTLTPPADTVVRFSKLDVRASQRVARLKVTATLAEAGTVKVTGTVNVPGASKAYRFKATTKRLDASGSVTLRPRLAAKAARAVRKALRRGKRLKARLTITATDLAGNSTATKKTVRLKR